MGVVTMSASASASCTSAKHSAKMLDNPWSGEGAVGTWLLVGVVGVVGWLLAVVGEKFATTDFSLVGVVIVGVVAHVEVEGWVAAVSVLVDGVLGGDARRWSGSLWVGIKSPSGSWYETMGDVEFVSLSVVWSLSSLNTV